MTVKMTYLALFIAIIGIQGALSQTLEVENEDGTHPCDRECVDGEDPKYCYYSWEIENYHSMSKACYDCPYNIEDCNRPDCVPADGINRTITVINRKMPGPIIVVCENDQVIVDVENSMRDQATTVHWHGIYQRATPYMDGAPYVTQCPIEPAATFRYNYLASPYGTQFWHSHVGFQRGDGVNGALVIRRPKELDPHADLYDYDLTEHTMIVTDWVHEPVLSKFTRAEHYNGTLSSPTLLVNGRGRFKVFNETDDGNIYMRASRFNVTQGSSYRFRVVNVEFMLCPIEISVDGHNLTFIATDGYDIEPVTATSFVTYAGERYDFIIEANNEVDNYWIKLRGLVNCDSSHSNATQVAVLHYDGASDDEPEGEVTWVEAHNTGLQVNPLNRGEEDNDTITVSEFQGLEDFSDTDVLKEVPDYQFYIAYDFYVINNTEFNDPKYYPISAVRAAFQTVTPQLNHITYQAQVSPLLPTRPSNETFCSSATVNETCETEQCRCTHVLQVPLGAVVEVIIIDEGQLTDANHPFHLHGHGFLVLEQRRLSSNGTTADLVKLYDELGLITRNLVDPPRKDTVTVPDGGYTVIRFKADNPGYWMFHCHIEFHFEVGMALIFKVGEHDEMVDVPDDFPTCGDYLPDI